MSLLERTVLNEVRKKKNIILQHYDIEGEEKSSTFSLLQSQYEVGGKVWVRGYVFTPDDTSLSTRAANAIVGLIDKGKESINRHYILVTPEHVHHKTYFASESLPPPKKPVKREEPLEGVYLPPR